jgi:hypothetical protein
MGVQYRYGCACDGLMMADGCSRTIIVAESDVVELSVDNKQRCFEISQ